MSFLDENIYEKLIYSCDERGLLESVDKRVDNIINLCVSLIIILKINGTISKEEYEKIKSLIGSYDIEKDLNLKKED
jgi:hypothetical protein